MDISEEAKTYIKKNRKKLCIEFADVNQYPSVKEPSSYFMAGSPGSGKTEWSKAFINELLDKNPQHKIVRVDPDEIREWIPTYIPEQAHLFQGAVGIGVQKIIDHVLNNNQNFLLDGTFSNYKVSYKNIERSLNKLRKVGILYIYQDPLIAWDFTVKRAVIERRSMPKGAFIDAFFKSKENVNMIKGTFKKEVEVSLVIKDSLHKVKKVYLNIENIDNYIKSEYNPQTLEEKLV